ncbi:STAS domain-containing protein [bacterium]|nr:STAS domain-containing protein [bacterium]
MEGIQVSVDKAGISQDISIIRVGGYIDTTTSAELERALDSLLKAGVCRVIIDLNNVDYISSAGWGIFISEIKGIRERGGDLLLARMMTDVYEVFELLEFHYILKSYDSIDAAVADFDQGESGRSAEVPIKEVENLEPKDIHAINEAFDMAPNEEATVEDKVRVVALANPEWGPSKISKELNTERFGFLRVGTLTIWKMLRDMGLGSRQQRQDMRAMED